MSRVRLVWVCTVGLGMLLGLGEFALSQQAEQKKEKKGGQKKEKKTSEVWTDPKDPKLPPDFWFQGEYVGEMQMPAGSQRVGLLRRRSVSLSSTQRIGAQVIALGSGTFQAVLLPGGLPGTGWDGKNKILMHGVLQNEQVILSPAAGNRKYLAQKPEEFSATSIFPPPGQQNASGTISANTLRGQTEDGRSFVLQKTVSRSATMCLKPPDQAIILFDGSDADEWTRGRVDDGSLHTDGSDIVTKRKFNNYTMHLEFRLPYRPEARGQGRGNSGFYQVHFYEVQILDSFGLDGKNNECGGLYSQVEPKLNMCFPPLTWQTYDVDFTNAVRGPDGKLQKARLTARLNGVVIHDNVEIPGPTGGHRNDPEGTPGPILLQGHGNPLQFRNIWIVENK